MNKLINKAIRKAKAGDYITAKSIYKKILRKSPYDLDANYLLGTLYAESGNFNNALDYLLKASKIDPSSPYIYNNLGNVYQKLARTIQAKSAYENAIELKWDLPEAHLNLGLINMHAGDADAAISNFKKAAQLNPNMFIAEAYIASILERKGQYEDALKIIEPLLYEHYSNLIVVTIYSDIVLHGHKDKENIEKAASIFETIVQNKKILNAIPPLDRVKLYSTLGQIHDKASKYVDAFNDYKTANEQLPSSFDKSSHAEELKKLRSNFSQDAMPNIHKNDNQGEDLVFIVSMPRSGSTLVEQMLVSHPDVCTVGESDFVSHMLHRNITASDGHYDGVLDDKQARALAEKYHVLAKEKAGENKVVVDKSITNYLYLGYIYQIFPSAKIIHVKRHPLDTCLSCFFHDFYGQLDFTNDLYVLGEYYRQYEELMAHWQECLPLSILNVSYEDIVKNTNRFVSEILDYCGLEFNEKCLHFYNNERFVTTSSYHQVSKPIYDTSVNRYRHYEQFLDPLKKGLGLIEG